MYFEDILTTQKELRYVESVKNSNSAQLDVDHTKRYFLDGLSFSTDNATYSPLHVLTAASFTPRFLTLNQSSAVLMVYPFTLISNHILHLFNSVIKTTVFPEKATPKFITTPKAGASLSIENPRPEPLFIQEDQLKTLYDQNKM
uniref:Uncharacterized protein n=1 Tax=Glossina palpalis gambiensis TaxID=67801 RepID=A0A1B0BH67_9MUSC